MQRLNPLESTPGVHKPRQLRIVPSIGIVRPQHKGVANHPQGWVEDHKKKLSGVCWLKDLARDLGDCGHAVVARSNGAKARRPAHPIGYARCSRSFKSL